MAKAFLIYKGTDKHTGNSYKHISVLPVVYKALEKIISTHFNRLFLKYFLPTYSPFGFHKKKSTEAAFVLKKEPIYHSI